MPHFEHDGLHFHDRSEGDGVPVVWQHGLGSDVDQTFGLLEETPGRFLGGARFLGFDARGHGQTRPLGDEGRIGIAHSADDLRAFLDRRGIAQAVIGGISMGAAIALNFAVRHPGRVLGLVLSRPAWLDQPLPENLRIFTRIAEYIRAHGAVEGKRRFLESAEFAALKAEAPDSAQVVINHFDDPRAEECVVRLERIPRDAPSRDRGEWRAISVPTLVLANRQDPIHPWELAETLALIIPGAEFREITSKSVDLDRHAGDVRYHLRQFLDRHFGSRISAGE
jgi:pimeloyl-ACP methyl ester carboxylesterase